MHHCSANRGPVWHGPRAGAARPLHWHGSSQDLRPPAPRPSTCLVRLRASSSAAPRSDVRCSTLLSRSLAVSTRFWMTAPSCFLLKSFKRDATASRLLSFSPWAFASFTRACRRAEVARSTQTTPGQEQSLRVQPAPGWGAEPTRSVAAGRDVPLAARRRFPLPVPLPVLHRTPSGQTPAPWNPPGVGACCRSTPGRQAGGGVTLAQPALALCSWICAVTVSRTKLGGAGEPRSSSA